jgi:hypothetical protein
MSEKHGLNWNVELADAKVLAAIRYPDPGSTGERNRGNVSAVVGMCLGLILSLDCIAFVLLYQRVL